MNRLILELSELSSLNSVTVGGRRADHIRSTLTLNLGDKLRFGLVNGNIGTATLVEDSASGLRLNLEYSQDLPIPNIPCTLVIALPRPKAARRIIQSACSLGIEELHLINSSRVEKSYWQSHYLSEDVLEEQLLLGMEQSGSTFKPKIVKHTKFRPFVEDVFPNLCMDKIALLAHPYAEKRCPVNLQKPSVLVIGPEGGFTEFEVDLLSQNGAAPVTIGERILRVETAVPAILGRLYC